jgi:hypothetical protein
MFQKFSIFEKWNIARRPEPKSPLLRQFATRWQKVFSHTALFETNRNFLTIKTNEMTKKISFALAVALLLILFNSCRQEFLTQENENQKNLKNYKVYTIDKKQITTDFKLFEKIAKLQNIFSQRMETGKSVQDSILDGAIIGINKVLVVEENGVKSYTFPLKRIFPNGKIENLVLKRNADSTFSGVLVQ